MTHPVFPICRRCHQRHPDRFRWRGVTRWWHQFTQVRRGRWSTPVAVAVVVALVACSAKPPPAKTPADTVTDTIRKFALLGIRALVCEATPEPEPAPAPAPPEEP